ncbi:hypothetical protein KHM83_06615 [Fusibacter paucivorans]|uniref:Haemolysin-type calcium binding-related domain-containing protein n=1 Tax=Fusibacter paucivorans TaxID=76009 RepID=A0ABS5PME1_9FIRM|nr:calcium-binding protein [Fusibacter paucivorans]MBS7526344.1 hypothetical protein [Fusibacter paucivorans]
MAATTPDTASEDKIITDTSYMDQIYKRNGDDLVIEIFNDNNSITIDNWFDGEAYQVDTIIASNNNVMYNENVSQLIQAMAAYSSENGISWQQALEENPEEVQNILTSYWTHSS